MLVWANFAEQDNRFCQLGKDIKIYRTYFKKFTCMRKIFTILTALLVCTTSFAIYLDAPTYSVVGQDLKINGTADSGEQVVLTLFGWMEIGFDTKGAYGISSLSGTINGVNVENKKEPVSIYQDGFVSYLSANLEDANGNEYALEAGLLGLTSDIVKPGDTIYVEANDMTITPQYGNLRLRATEVGTGKKIDLQLVEGEKTGFGSYGYPNNDTTAFANVENARYDGYNVMLELNKEYNKAEYYQEGEVTIFEGVFDDQDSNDIYFLYLSTPSTSTELDNINVMNSPIKTLENGNVVIINNGVKYNILGELFNY